MTEAARNPSAARTFEGPTRGTSTSAKIGGGDRRGRIELAAAGFRCDAILGITMS